MGRKKRHEGEHDSSERWLLTYADLITLLLGLFVILYAGSQVDAKKFEEVMSAFSQIFGGGAGILDGQAGALSAPVLPKEQEEKLREMVKESLGDALENAQIALSESERGVTVSVADVLLFDPAQAALRPEALPVLEKIARTVSSVPNEIRVEGHTDNAPIRTGDYPSNWHLSVARSLNVAYYLLEHGAIDPSRMAITGFGEFRPVAPNETPEGRARNRRVDIVLVK